MWSRFYAAVTKGQCDVVESFLQKGVCVNGPRNRLPPLNVAVQSGHKDIVELLLRNNANIEGRLNKASPLNVAVKNNNYEIAELLLQNGANVESCCGEITPLYEAVSNNSLKIIELLLRHGAIVDSHPDKLSPLLKAVYDNRREIVELLLPNSVYIEGNPDKLIPLYDAAERYNHDMFHRVFELAENGEDILPAIDAVRANHPVFKELNLLRTQKDANVERNRYGIPALYEAIVQGHENIVEVLLQYGVNVEGIHIFPNLPEAIAQGHSAIVEHLLQYGAHRRSDDQYLQLLLEALGRFEMINVILNYGIRSNVRVKNSKVISEETETFKLFQHPQVFQHLLESCFCNPESKKETTDPMSFPRLYSYHLMKLCAANLHPLAEKLELSMFWCLAGEKVITFKNECMAEVALMKKLSVGSMNVTFYDILTDVSLVSRYSKNSGFARILNSGNLYKKFPIYADILKCQFQTGKQRKLALKEGVKKCHNLSLFKKLPNETKEFILNHLSSEELLNFKTACCRTIL